MYRFCFSDYYWTRCYLLFVSTDVSCNGGSDGVAFVDSVSGGTAPYFYTWSTGQNTSIINNLTLKYTLSVTDVNNCTSNPPQVSVIVNGFCFNI